MSPNKLVMMANQIAKFFISQGRDQASAGIADHLKKYWDPRMRSALVAYWRAGGEGLEPEVRLAVAQLVEASEKPAEAPSRKAQEKQDLSFWMRLGLRKSS